MNKLLVVIALAVVGCGGGGGGSAKLCSPKGQLTQACSDCRETMCNNENIACLGPDYKNGNYTGPCAALVTCTCACASGDVGCFTACNSKDTADCDNCNAAVTTCDEKCADKCSGAMQNADMSMASGGNCAALSACCTQLPANEQSGCNTAATSETDAQCASALSGFQAAGQCH